MIPLGMGYSIEERQGNGRDCQCGKQCMVYRLRPAEKPQIAVCVLIENSSESSSTVAVPIARQLFARYVK